MKVKCEQDGSIGVYTDDCDLCNKCTNTASCPLIGALNSEVTIIRYESIEIEQCGMFKEKKRAGLWH